MADPRTSIPLEALASRFQRQPYQDPELRRLNLEQQQLTLQNLRRQGQVGDLQLQEAQRKQQEQAIMREIFMSDIPEEKIPEALRRKGFADLGLKFQQDLYDRNTAFSQMGLEKTKALQAETEQDNQYLNALLGLKPEARDAQFQRDHPGQSPPTDLTSDDAINFTIKSGTNINTYLDRQHKIAEEQRAQAEEVRKAAAAPIELGTKIAELQTLQKKLQESPTGTWTESTITVNGKGPVLALRNPQGQYIDVNTRQPIQGKIGEYEKPTAAMGEDAAIELSPEALDIVAKRYLQDGTLPPMGMGVKAAGMRARVINRAAKIDPNAVIAANAAEFNSNKQVLTQLQKNQAAVGAFEQTAQKNLQQFINTARKVRDSGSPILNRGLRSLDRNVLGTTEQAAYDAARQVAFVELARVVSNPNLVGVLSDNARREMEQILSGDATLAQTLRASEVLLQDMQNRKGGIDDQIKVIQDRLRNPAGAPAAQGGGAGAAEELEFGPDGKLRPLKK